MIINLIDWFLAFLPVLTVLILMLRFHWDGSRAGAIGWTLALLIAAAHFGAGWEVLAYAQLKGVLLTLFVLYIIWGALLFYRVTDEAGAVETIGAGLPRLTPDRGLQALLLGWVFSAFLQGMGGFGVPVAVIAPLLIGMGFPPIAAVVIPSVGFPWAVTFGSLGSSFFALMAATGRSGDELAPWTAVMLGVACLGCGAATLWAAGGRRTLFSNLAPLLLIGGAMAGTQYVVVTNGFWPIGAMMSGLLGLAVGVAWARWKARWGDWKETRGKGLEKAQPLKSPPSTSPGMRMGWALLPYLLLVAIILLAQTPPVKRILGQVVVNPRFPELTTSKGWTMAAGHGRSINLFGHAGALLIYASLITYAVYRWRGCYTPGAVGRIARSVAQKASRSSLGTAAMVGMAVTMEHAGMTHLLADGIARVAGPAFPLVSPFIGALGAFMTGSNTNSNVVFGALQQNIATLIGVSPIIILAAQTAGASIGSAFAPAKIIVGCSTVGSGKEEGPVLKATLRYGLSIVAVLAALTWMAVK